MARNSEYWIKRAEQLKTSEIVMAEKSLAELDKIYQRAIATVRSDLEKWYARFASNNEISLVEAQKLLKARELVELKWSVEEYIKYGRENALDNRWIKELENASARVHISRLEAIELQIRQQIEIIHKNRASGLETLTAQVYEDTYYKTAYQVQTGLNLAWAFDRLDQKAIIQIISKPWAPDGVNFSSRIWNDRTKLVNILHRELSQSIIRGESPKRVIDLIAKQFDVSKRTAGRLVMTESAFFSSTAKEDSYKELDVEKYEIVATLDGNTSEICRDLDKEVFPMSKYEPGVTAPPFHQWCRSTTAPYFEDEEGYRAARGKDGKVYYVPSNLNYKDWFEQYVK